MSDDTKIKCTEWVMKSSLKSAVVVDDWKDTHLSKKSFGNMFYKQPQRVCDQKKGDEYQYKFTTK